MKKIILFLLVINSLIANATINACKSSDFLQLKDNTLQNQFLEKVDSILKVQYPNNDQEKSISPDINKFWLDKFLEDIITDSLLIKNTFFKKYHFNVSTKEHADPKECYDSIRLTFNPTSCSFTLVIDNSFFVPPNWCTQTTVLYYVTLKNGTITSFGRNEAG